MRRSAVPAVFAALMAAAALSFPSATQAAMFAAGAVRGDTSSTTSTPPIEVTAGRVHAGPPIRAGFVGITTEYRDMFTEVGTNPAQPSTRTKFAIVTCGRSFIFHSNRQNARNHIVDAIP